MREFMRLWERIQGFARFGRGLGEICGMRIRGFMRLWERIHEFVRIHKTLGEDL